MSQGSTRRRFLQHGALGLGVLPMAGFWPVAASARSAQPFPIAQTDAGKVRGMDFGGVVSFKGIPYGAPTGGANRFKPARKPAAWKEVRNAFGFGEISPQMPADMSREFTQIIEWDKQNGGMGEDCLKLNVWTPTVGEGATRPVFVSFHGGGFSSGSAGAPGFDGDYLARYADAVVVTINHRLAAFGFLHLGDVIGPEFASSGTLGMTDLVAALQWVKANIAHFGGDPDNVMIFGQSGGGRKVSAMLAMPSATGLFHRAAVQSGSISTILTREQATENARKLMAALDIAPARARALQNVPFMTLLEAQAKVIGAGGNMAFMPVLDGVVFPQHPFEPTAPAGSAGVPLIIGTALDESAETLTNFDLDEAGVRAYADKRFGASGARILAAYRAEYPNTSPFLLQAKIDTQLDRRSRALHQANRRAALGRGNTWLYRFDCPSPAYGGKFGAVHGIDVGLVFHNALTTITAAPTPELVALNDQMAKTWIAFARTGDPNNASIPRWRPYDETTRVTMLFDARTRAVEDPDRTLRRLHAELKTPAKQ